MTARVLVVDDDPAVAEVVTDYLRHAGMEPRHVADGHAALRLAGTWRPDLVVLDVMLPDLDGFEVCRRLRAGGNDVPVIFLTARDTSSDTVTGLALGGDDYVTKPFSVEALVARIRAVLRRVRAAAGTGGQAEGDDDLGGADVLRVGDLELDEARWMARRGSTQLELSPTEFRLLAFLMRHPGRVLTRAQLLEHVWGWDYGGQSQIVETYVSYLRRKLDPLGPPLIHTQRGIGYALRPAAGASPARDAAAPARDGG